MNRIRGIHSIILIEIGLLHMLLMFGVIWFRQRCCFDDMSNVKAWQNNPPGMHIFRFIPQTEYLTQDPIAVSRQRKSNLTYSLQIHEA